MTPKERYEELKKRIEKTESQLNRVIAINRLSQFLKDCEYILSEKINENVFLEWLIVRCEEKIVKERLKNLGLEIAQLQEILNKEKK